VNYLNERKRFTPEQIAAIMFSKLKHITSVASATKPIDCVIGVSFYIKINFEEELFYGVRSLVFLLMLNDEQCLMQHK
jgi:hypothetical protein